MSNGSSNVISGSRFSPVTFLMEYLNLILSVSSLFSSTSLRRSSIARMNPGWLDLNDSFELSSPVSRTVPSGRTILAETIILSELACMPQLIPEALFMTIPPTMQEPIDAGSGPNFLPRGLRISFTFAPTSPGSMVISPASSEMAYPSQFFPATTSTESLTACPERLVPAALKVTGTFSLSAVRRIRDISSSFSERITIFGTSR